MPENDLGTAHGKIRIDFEDRASTAATAALVKIQKQMEQMNDRLAKIDKTFQEYDKELDKNTKAVDKSTKSAKAFHTELFSTHKELTSFLRDIKNLNDDLNKMSTAFSRVQTNLKPFVLGARAIDQFSKNMADGRGRTESFTRALSTAGVASAIFNRQVGLNILGVKGAMREMPSWTQDLYRYAGGLAKVGVAGDILRRTLGSGGIERLIGTRPFQRLVKDSEIAKLFLEDFARTTDRNLSRLSQSFDKNLKPLSDFAKSGRGFIAGAALVKAGVNEIADRFRWLGKIPKPILYGLQVSIADVLPAALKVFGQALVLTSNLFAGALSGAKQLAGGLLVLPGLYATIGAAVSPLIGIFAGLKNQLKDVFSDDPNKAMEAYFKLPDHLRPLADALLVARDRLKDLQTTLQTIAIKGLADDIKSLTDIYLPRLRDGGIKVTLAWRQMKDEVVGFFKETSTQRDISQIYTNTASAMTTLGHAIRPVADGLRDITSVGNEFLMNMTASAPRLSQEFAKWADTNRRNGNFMQWMQESRAGAVDLTKGMVELGKAVWTILTLFRDKGNDNFLATFAKDMTGLNNAIQKSALTGFLSDIREAVRQMAGRDIQNFKSLWADVAHFFHDLLPVINTLAQSFASTFVPVLKEAFLEFRLIADAIHALGLDTLIGLTFGVVAGWTTLSNIMVPLTAKLKLFIGLWMTLGNYTKVADAFRAAILGIDAILAKMGPRGQALGTSLVNMGLGMQGVIGIAARLVTGITLLLAAIGALYEIHSQGRSQMIEFQASLDESAKHAVKFTDDLNKAFVQDRGQFGHTVMDTISNRLSQMVDDLQSTANKTPGIMAKMNAAMDPAKMFGDWRSYIAPWTKAQDAQVQSAEDLGKKARMAAAGIEELRLKGVDITGELKSSDEEWKNFSDHLRSTGDQGKAAADQLQTMRDSIKTATADVQLLGPAGETAASGFDKIAKSAGDAQSKLEGLQSVLEALGLLQINSLEAAAKYTDSIEGLTKKVQDAIEAGDGLNNVFKDGTLNVAGSQTARNLVPVFGDLSRAFMDAATHGGDIDDMVKRLKDQLPGLAQQLGVDQKTLENFLATKAGISPDIVKITVQLDKVPEAQQAFGKLVADLMGQAKTGIFLPINLGTNQAAIDFDKQLQGLLGKDFFDVSQGGKGSVIELKPDINMADLQAKMPVLLDYLSKHGFDVSALGGAGGGLGQPGQISLNPTIDQGALDAVNKQLDDLIAKRAQLQGQYDMTGGSAGYGSTDPAVQNLKHQLDDLDRQISDLQAKKQALTAPVPGTPPGGPQPPPAAGPMPAPTTPTPTDQPTPQPQQPAPPQIQQQQTQLQQVQDQVAAMAKAIQDSLAVAQGAMDQFIKDTIDKFADPKMLQAIQNSGSALVDALAAGIRGNHSAIDAINDMAQNIMSHWHQSPPKKGPLSRHGDAVKYAGELFSKSYAEGIKAGTPNVEAASSSMGDTALSGTAGGGVGIPASDIFGGSGGVGGGSRPSSGGGVPSPAQVTSGMGKGVEQAGQVFGKRISKLLEFVDHAIQAFGKISESALGFMKFASDPLGKGTFFGQSLGSQFGYRQTGKVSPEQARKNYEDRLQQAAISAGTGATRDMADYDPLTGLPKLTGAGGSLTRTSSKSDIQGAVAAAGRAAGASDADIAAAFAIIDQETGGTYKPDIVGKGMGGGGADAIGLFQQTQGLWGSLEELSNPNIAIQKYWDAWKTTGPQQGHGYFAPQDAAAQRAVKTQNPGGYGPGEILKRMGGTSKELQSLLASGGILPTTSGALPGLGAFPGVSGQLPIRPGLKIDETGTVKGKTVSLVPAADLTARMIGQIFPAITTIGGVRDDPMEWHPTGRGLDIMIPGADQSNGDAPTPPAAKALGDAIAAWVAQNATQLGVEGYIWQNTWRQGGTNQIGAKGAGQEHGHMNHVHISFTGAPPAIGPQGSGLKMPYGPGGVPQGVPQGAFGPPNLPGTPGATPSPTQQLYTLDAQGKPVPISMAGPDSQGMKLSTRLTPNGLDVLKPDGSVIQTLPLDQKTPVPIKDEQGRVLGIVRPGGPAEPGKPAPPPFLAPPEPLNPATGQPWTSDEAAQFSQQHPLRLNYGDLTPQQIQDLANTPGIVTPQPGGKVTDALGGDVQSLLAQAQGPTGTGTAALLQQLEVQRQNLISQDTPESRAQAKALEQVQSSLMSEGGYEAAQNPFEQGMSTIQGMTGVAGDVIHTMQAGIEAVGATKNIADTLIRGVENTEDIYKMIDDVQKYITFAADIAQTVGDALSMVGSVAGAAGGPGSGAISAAAQVAQMVSAALQTANAIIDLGQEAYRMVGSYLGPVLQDIAGGPEGALQGNVKFLLDTKTNQLLAYSADNPLDKRAHTMAFQTANPDARNQMIGQLNVYGGPGQDPRDNTRQMMFQVKASTMQQATSG